MGRNFQQGTVAITKETEIMRKRIIVNHLPVALHESGNQEQQGTLRLVEIRNDAMHYMKLIARSYNNLRCGVQYRQMVAIEISQNGFQRLNCGQRTFAALGIFIGQPLRHMQILLLGIRMTME
ncbi:hypothetical protein EVA_05408 [gut metagenome]|uniref:Uncharacterized protein n=1 Tax=gut metagenome TaxID=749906 RepID=J9GGG4_9ZZZZ